MPAQVDVAADERPICLESRRRVENLVSNDAVALGRGGSGGKARMGCSVEKPL